MNSRRPERRLGRSADSAEEGVRVELLKAAYEAGHRALDQQYSALTAIRQRSVQFMAFVGSATAFLVGSAISAAPTRGILFYVSLVSATVISLASLLFLFLVLLALVRKPDLDAEGNRKLSLHKRHYWMIWRWGRAEWNFSVDPEVLIEDWVNPRINPSGISEFYRDLALHSQSQLDENDFYMVQIYRWYNLFVAFAALQVIAWSVTAWIFV